MSDSNFPFYSGIQNSMNTPEIVKCCLETFSTTFRDDSSLFTANLETIRSIIDEYESESAMDLLAIMLDFHSIVTIKTVDSSPDISTRFLFAAGYFANQLKDMEKQILNKGSVAMQNLFALIDAQEEKKSIFLAAVGYFLANIGTFYIGKDISNMSNRMLVNYIQNTSKFFDFAIENGDPSMAYFSQFSTFTLYSIHPETVFTEELCNLFTNTITHIINTITFCSSSTFDYVSLVSNLLDIIDNMSFPLILRLNIFCLLAKIPTICSDAVEKIFCENGIMKIGNFVASFIAYYEQEVQYSIKQEVPQEIISGLLNPNIDHESIIDTTFQNGIGDIPKFTKLDIKSPADAINTMPKDFITLLGALTSLCRTNTPQNLVSSHFSILQQVLSVLSNFTLGYLQMVFIACWVRSIVIANYEEASKILETTQILDSLLSFAVHVCSSNELEELILSIALFVWSKTRKPIIIQKICKAFEESVVSLSCDDLIFQYLLSAFLTHSSKSIGSLSSAFVDQRIANFIFLLQALHVNAINNNKTELIPLIEKMRRYTFSFTENILNDKAFLIVLAGSQFFVEAIIRLVHEISILDFSSKLLAKIVSLKSIANTGFDIAFTFFDKIVSKKNQPELIPLNAAILNIIVTSYDSNPSRIAEQLFATNIVSGLVDYVAKSQDLQSMNMLMGLTEKCSKMRGSLREHINDIDIFSKLLPIVDVASSLGAGINSLLLNMWSVVFEDKLEPVEVHQIKNASPLPLIFLISKRNDADLLKFLDYVFQCCTSDVQSTLEVNNSDFPSYLIKAVAEFRICPEHSDVLDSLLNLFEYLSSYSMKSKDMLSFMQCFTSLPGNFKPYFTHDLLKGLVFIFQTPYDAPSSFFHLSGNNTVMKMPSSKNIFSINELTFFIDIELSKESEKECHELFTMSCNGGATITLFMNKKMLHYELKDSKNVFQGFFSYPFVSNAWTHIAVTYLASNLTLFVHGKEQEKKKVGNISFTGDLHSAKVADNLPCNIYNFGVLRQALKSQLIHTLASLPRSSVCTFTQSELSSLPTEFKEIAQGSIYGSAIYLYNACVARGETPINIALNYTVAQMEFNGQITAFSPPGKSILKSIGGPSALLPLIAQLDQPTKPKEGEEIKYEFDPQSLRFIIQLFTDYIRNSHENQKAFAEQRCFEIIGFLLSRAKAKHINEEIVVVLKRLLNEITFPPLAAQMIEYILLDFRIWIYQPVTIQSKIIDIIRDFFSKLSPIMKKYFMLNFTTTKLFFLMRVCLWSKFTDAHICLLDKPKLDPVTKEIEVERPKDLSLVREAFWKIILEYSNHSFSRDDSSTLCFFSMDISDPILTVETLGVLIKLLKNGTPALIEEIRENYTFESFFPLLIAGDSMIHAQCIHLFMSITKLDKELRDILLEPYSINDWLSGIMATINFSDPTLLFSDVVFSYLFDLPEYSTLEPPIKMSKQPISFNRKISNYSILPLAIMSIAYLPDDKCFNLAMILEQSVNQDYQNICKVQDWDIPFIMFLMHKNPVAKQNSLISMPSTIVLRILSTIYYNLIIDYKQPSYLDRVPNICNMLMAQTGFDYTHITRLIFSAFLTNIIMKENLREKLGNKCIFEVFKLIFEYLFFIPDSSYFFTPFAFANLKEPTSFQEIHKAHLTGSPPKISFAYGTRTTMDKYIWQDADLADTFLSAIEQVPALFSPNAKHMPSKFPNTWLVYAFTLSIGIQHPSHFSLFMKHIRCLTEKIPRKDLSALQKQAWVLYMGGLIHVYMLTDRSHQSHIYLQEDATSFSRVIYKNYKMRLRWGTSIDSFDSCFKDPMSGHHFAYQILEEYSEIESQLVDYGKSTEKLSQRIISQATQNTKKYADHFKNLDITVVSKHLQLTTKKIKLQLVQYAANLKNSFYHGSKSYSKLLQALSGDNGPWRSPEIQKEYHYRLSNTLLYNGRRDMLVENSKFNDHKDASLKQERKGAREAEEVNDNLKKRAGAFTGSESVISIDAEIEEEVAASSTDAENIILKVFAKLVTMKKVLYGSFTITPACLLYESSESAKCVSINRNDITYILFRRYLFLDNSIEIFTTKNKAYFIEFAEGQREMVIESLHKLRIKNAFIQKKEDDIKPLIEKAQEKWINGEMSNFDYLMTLNILSGRTYNDLSQYPVFPWILQDYTSPQLDLSDPNVYRDLSKPIAAHGEERLAGIMERFEDFEDDVVKYQYAAFYSNSATVIGYLIRLEPFTSLHIALQSGRFDVSDRLFHSIPAAWKSAISTAMDFRELIPEFFYFPDFLVNKDHFNLGKSSISTPSGDVVLPPWASSPSDFVNKNRMALESPYVSSNLPKWIDMIFGVTSRGPKALEINNLFNPQFFEESVTDEVRNNPEQLMFIQEYAACFGQGPHQIFKDGNHPQKKVEILPFATQSHEYKLLFSDKDCSIMQIECKDSMVTAVTSTLNVLKYNVETFDLVNIIMASIDIPKPDEIQKIQPTVSIRDGVVISAMPWECAFVVTVVKNIAIHMHTIRTHTRRITASDISRKHYIIGSADCTATIWRNNPEANQVSVNIIFKHKTPIVAVSINDEANIAVSCSKDGTIATTALSGGQSLRTIEEASFGKPRFCKILDTGIIIIAFETVEKTTIRAYSCNLNLIGEVTIPELIECINVFDWKDGTAFAVVALKSRKLLMINIPFFYEIWKEDFVDFVVTAIGYIKKKNTIAFGTNDGKVIELHL